jgi:HNH endonuclease
LEIRVGLTTLLGLDERPAELPGWGPVTPEVARDLVARQHGGEWRFAIIDEEGYLVLAGLTRRRPAGSRGDPRCRETRGGIVELQVPARTLAQLAADSGGCGGWAGVVADLAAPYAAREHSHRQLHGRPGDRFIRAGLRRHIQIRDRSCVGVGCRRPAAGSEADHTVDHALGGPTVPGNSGPLCRKDHRKKHHGGWHLDQPAPGRFRWTSPLGQVYSTRGEPIWPELPEPLPAHRAAAHRAAADRAVAGRAVADRANPGPTPPIIDASPPTGHRAPAETGPAPPEPDPPPF